MTWRTSSFSSGNGQCVELAYTWRKSSASSANGQCVEVTTTDALAAFRDSKNPTGPILVIPANSLTALVAAITT
ncbi:DUF397 domain-containing protein [Actinokineospora inagensis]|uniref:DUF397 domain-containing protein n=1 Tax=Actinokineospora inagensis TaxID=103730 RepID=UPI000421DC19|nr:DUF397 domain-containing protein [Actinokineospora inagensis]